MNWETIFNAVDDNKLRRCGLSGANVRIFSKHFSGIVLKIAAFFRNESPNFIVHLFQ